MVSGCVISNSQRIKYIFKKSLYSVISLTGLFCSRWAFPSHSCLEIERFETQSSLMGKEQQKSVVCLLYGPGEGLTWSCPSFLGKEILSVFSFGKSAEKHG